MQSPKFTKLAKDAKEQIVSIDAFVHSPINRTLTDTVGITTEE